MNEDALIGGTGFVGGNLLRQHPFSTTLNSRTIDAAAGQSFDTVVCAAAPGSMFEANNFPDRDKAKMDALTDQLSRIGARRFVLVSSIAVLARFDGGDDETTTAFQEDLAYGRHRRALEAFCADHFDDCLILRLPALYGEGLKKNFIFDLLNPVPSMLTPARFDDALAALDPAPGAALKASYGWNDTLGMHAVDRAALRATGQQAAIEAGLGAAGITAVQFTHPDTRFQYYGLDRLWADIGTCFANGIDVLHLATEPLRAGDVHLALTGREMPDTGARLHREDMHSLHAGVWGREGPYMAGAGEVMAGLTAFWRARQAEAA